MKSINFLGVEDGEDVAAVHHDCDSDRWIFFCHGYGSGKDGSYVQRCEEAVENGFNAVRFDFRGNGESDGDFIDQSLSSRIKDLKRVVSEFDPERFSLFGMSFGGKVVIHSLEDLSPESIVLKSPVLLDGEMSEFREIVEEEGSYTHFGDKTIDESFFTDYDRYSFQEIAGSIEAPVAVFHGLEDGTVEPESTLEAAKHFDTDTTIEMISGESHSMTEKAEERVRERMFSWLNRQD
jgi:Predicted hydrolases or acyltransferases (alpha/beta hydrolase superfamily)